MSVYQLTGREVVSTKPKRKQYVIWDKKTKGFGLRVSRTGRKAFIVNITRHHFPVIYINGRDA